MLRPIRAVLLWAALAALPSARLAGQSATAPLATPPQVFVDCESPGCDFDYFRTEVTFVEYVRDRADADVHVLVTAQPTGAGGRAYQVEFLGQRRFAGMRQALRHTAAADDTQDELRAGLARLLRLGLVQFAAQTPVGERLSVAYAAPEAAVGAAVERDRWNHWTLRTSARGFFSGESSYRSHNLNGSVSANRTTEEWKVRLSVSASENRSRTEYEDGDTAVVFRNRNTSRSANATVARSLGPHWSAGVRGSAYSSTRTNQERALRLAPVVEYSLFPYAQATRRQLTVQYSVGVNGFEYYERTLYGRDTETRLDHALVGSLDFKQPWGSAALSVERANYLHDFARSRTSASAELELRLVRGLSLDLYASGARIYDQLYLSAAGATPEEILTQQKALATNFSYFASVGLSYTVGSRRNSVVNPRLDGSGGGSVFF